MQHFKQWLIVTTIAFGFASLLAIKSELPIIVAAGVLGSVAVSIIFVLVLVAVKLANKMHTRLEYDLNADVSTRRLNGFDTEGNLMIHSWLWHGGK